MIEKKNQEDYREREGREGLTKGKEELRKGREGGIDRGYDGVERAEGREGLRNGDSGVCLCMQREHVHV